jgi:hypothetical protein
MLYRMMKDMFTPHAGGYLFTWVDVTKSRQGDKATGKATEPFVTGARHRLLVEILSRAPDSGPLFPVPSVEVRKVLHRWFDDEVPPGFVLTQHGLRNGTDIALRALELMEDYIDAHGGWARLCSRMSQYYAGLQLAVLMAATELLPLVRFTPAKPGWYDVDAVPDHPDWSSIVPSAVVVPPPSVFDVDDDVESDDDPGDSGSSGYPLRDLPAPSRPATRRQTRVR